MNRRHPLLLALTLTLLIPAAPGPTLAEAGAPADSASALTAGLDETEQVPLADVTGSDEPRPLAVVVDTQFSSHYLFQGLESSYGNAVAQPTVTLGFGRATVGFWGNYDMETSELNEIDLTAQVTQSIGPLAASVGYVHLRFPHRAESRPTHELVANLAFTAPLNPVLNVHQDVAEGDGTYATLGVSQPLPAGITVGGNLFYQSHYFDLTGIPAVELNVKMLRNVGAMRIVPAVSHFFETSNGDFGGDGPTPESWLLTLGVGRNF